MDVLPDKLMVLQKVVLSSQCRERIARDFQPIGIRTGSLNSTYVLLLAPLSIESGHRLGNGSRDAEYTISELHMLDM